MQKMHDRKNVGKLLLDPSLEPKPQPVAEVSTVAPNWLYNSIYIQPTIFLVYIILMCDVIFYRLAVKTGSTALQKF